MENALFTSVPLATIEARFADVVEQKLQLLLIALKDNEKASLPSDYLNRKDTAKLLGISLVTLGEWTKTGKVQGYRIASRVRYKRAEIESSLSAIQTKRRA
jgi:hypothetical protein